MKTYFTLFIALLHFATYSQVTNQGIPKSWTYGLEKPANINSILLPYVNAKKLLLEDREKQYSKDRPMRFGKEISVDIGITTAGQWTTLPNGDKIWRLYINSKDAKSLNFVFSQYQLPEGATLHIYSHNKKHLLGAYTSKLNRKDLHMGTWPIPASKVWLEYYEPKNVIKKGKLHLSKVVHGYKTLTPPQDTNGKNSENIENCNYSVNCDIGEDFNFLKERLKHAVALIVTGGSVCTGVLVNNTAEDKAPFFLTANHCNIGLEATWAFRFNYISTETHCGEGQGTLPASQNIQTTSGASVLASNNKSDFKLLRLDGGLDTSWNLEWAGWDRSDIAPSFTVGIHHPNGELMEVCRDNNPPKKEDIVFGNPETEIWKIDNNNNGWETGVTAVGSSGSPLFNPTGKIIGLLSGGLASCNGATDNNLEDWYGRFAVSWDFENTTNKQLANWLDPLDTGALFLNMFSEKENPFPFTNINFKDLKIFPNPASERIEFTKGLNVTINYYLYNATGALIKKGTRFSSQSISVKGIANGVYVLKIENPEGVVVTKKIVIYR